MRFLFVLVAKWWQSGIQKLQGNTVGFCGIARPFFMPCTHLSLRCIMVMANTSVIPVRMNTPWGNELCLIYLSFPRDLYMAGVYVHLKNISGAQCKTIIPSGESQSLTFKTPKFKRKACPRKTNNTSWKWLYNKVERTPTYYLQFPLVDFGLGKICHIKLTGKYEKNADRLCEMSRKDAKEVRLVLFPENIS